MASLILLLSEIFKPETADLLVAGNLFPASSRSVASLKRKQIAGLSPLAGKKPERRTPENVGTADDVMEDPSELKVSVDMVWY